ncbi:GyrI-like domain-containing protein [Microbacterium sp. W1N]|uniref:GyrI-like domain-containing protein n=1 Tax=Microbacterium festucae TaxID=2977531 RepID=UPI0021C0F4D1|nr:GyrI-like domain-containing protein [Microbacterium festucae]MCT9820123.1 GyrI-like domain-containing protein [Microbacterium festucae]
MSRAAFPDAPFASPARIQLDPLPLAVVRHEGIRIDALRDAFDQGYSAIAGLFGDGTLVPTGPALAIYYGDPMDTFDLELGFPVAAAPTEPVVVGAVAVIGSALPSGPAIATTHTGAYDGLGQAWAELVHAVQETPTGVWIESYVSDPTDDPAELRTDLILPVRD